MRTSKLQRRVEGTRYHSQYDPTNGPAQQCLDTLKQKLSAVAGRLKRYKTSNNRKRDNALFQGSEKTFYRKLNFTPNMADNRYPNREQVEEFWGNQLSTPANCNIAAGCEEHQSKFHPAIPSKLIQS